MPGALRAPALTDVHRQAPARHRPDGPDRVGQDRARARLGAAAGRRDRQRRFRAGVSRPRHRRRQADGGRAGRRAAPHARPARSMAAVLGGGIRHAMRARARRHRAARQGADTRRRYRPVLPRAAARAVGHARSRCRRCAPRSKPKPAHAAGPRCTPNCSASIPRPPRASTPPTRSASSARWRCSAFPAAPSATGASAAVECPARCRCAC